MKRAYIYARVSTDEQAEEGISIDTQINVCTRWGVEHEYLIIRSYKDEGRSATNLNRPALRQLLDDIVNQKEVDAVLVQDTDRLARNTLDHLTIRNILRKNDIKLISINQPMLDDSPEGQMIDTILASVNTLQSQVTGRKTSKTSEEKARLGWYPKKAPFGYKNIENPDPSASKLEKRIIGLHEINSQFVVEIFNMYATGNYNLNDIADYLNEKGVEPQTKKGKKIHHTFVGQILKDEFYIGFFKWNGRREGKHPKLIREDLFYKVQRVLEAHNQGASRKRKHSYLLRGYLFCADCNNRMWAEPHKKKNKTYHFYYCKHCRKGTYADTELIEKQVAKLFTEIQLTESYVQKTIHKAQELLKQSREIEESRKRSLINQKSEVEKAMIEAEDKLLITKTLTTEAFERIYNRYEAQLKNINKEMEDVEFDKSQRIKIIENILKMAENIGETYANANPIQKKHYIGLFFHKLIVEKGKIIEWELSELVKPLIEEGSVRVETNWLPLLDMFRQRRLKFKIVSPLLIGKLYEV